MRSLLLSLMLFSFFSCKQTSAKAQIKVGPNDFEAAMAADSKAQLIDVRTPEEYAAGHLKGARLLNFYDAGFTAQLEQLDKDRPVLLYCHSGNRSGKAALLLKKMGFENISDLNGGIVAWQAAGKETVK